MGGGKANLGDFTIVKKIDTASAPLFMHCCTGEHFDEAKIVMRKAGGKGGQVEFLTYTMKQVLVSSIRPGGSAQGHDDIPHEEVSLNFGKITFDYVAQTAQGGKGATSHGGWDTQLNTPL